MKKNYKESILDPVHETLNPSLWDKNQKLKPEIKKYIVNQLKTWLNNTDYKNYKIDRLVFIGSNTGFSYNGASDIDINVLIEKLSDKQLNELRKIRPNGNNIPQTEHPVNYFLENKPMTLDAKKGSAYDILKDEWIIPPSKSKMKISYTYLIEFAKVFMIGIDNRIREYERDIKELQLYQSYLKLDTYDKKEVESFIERKNLELEAGLDGLDILLDMINKFRDEAYTNEKNPRKFFIFSDEMGNFSIQNQVYKILEYFGYIELLHRYRQLKKNFKEMKEGKSNNMKNKPLKELDISADITGSVDVPENQGTEKKKKEVIDNIVESKKLVKIIVDKDIFFEKNLTLKKGDILYAVMKEASEVASVLFSKDKWTIPQAKEWLKSHEGYKYGKVDDPEYGDYYHFKQQEHSKSDILRLSGDENSGEGQKALLAKGIKFIFNVG